MALQTTTDKSAKLQLFEDIETALQPLINDGTINSVEAFNSQTDFENQERPRFYPYVAVDFTTEWNGVEATNAFKQLAYKIQNEQKGNCIVTVYVIFENLDDETTAFKTAEPIRHCIHRYIQELDNKNIFTPLIRFADNLDSSHDRVFSYISQYRTNLIEMAIIPDDTATGAINDVTINSDLIIDNEVVRTAKDFS
jgi:hypothetical protein